MSFPTTGILDDFNRSDRSLAGDASWSTGGLNSELNGLAIVGNQLARTGATFSGRSAGSIGPDCELRLTAPTPTVPGGEYLCLALRLEQSGATGASGYWLIVFESGGSWFWRIERLTNGTATTLGADMFQAVAAGDTIGFEAIGSTLTAYHKPSGGSWATVGSRNDSTYTAAAPWGVEISDSNARFDDLGGGTVVVAGSDPGLNTNISAAIGAVKRCRFEIQETAGVATTNGYQLRFSKNGGAYTQVGAATDCRYVASAMFADGDPTTDLLTGGGGTFAGGEGCEDGVVGNISLGAAGHTELEFAVQLGGATVSGDTFDLRIYRSDGTPLDTYTNTPRITAA